MARFAVYEMRRGGLGLDLQSDFLIGLETRLVAPLVPLAQSFRPAKHLNPVFTLSDGQFVLLTQAMAAVRISELGRIIADLSAERDALTRALDMVFQGF